MARTILDKEIRRQQILDASIRVIARKGYRASSISDMVFEAGVARGTFYLYFDSKEEIFKAILDYYFQSIKNFVMPGMRQGYNVYDASGGLKDLVIVWLRFFDENRDLAKIVIREAAAIDPDYEFKYTEVLKAIHQHWESSMRQLQKIGVLRKDVDISFAGFMVSGMLNQAVLSHVLPSQKPDIEKLADKLANLIRKGIAQEDLLRWT